MTVPIDEQFRRALRWYPRSWRARHEDAMIGTLLELAASENRSRSTVGERAHLAVHGVVARAGTVVPASVRNGVASVALVTGTAFAIAYFVFLDWAPWAANAYRASGQWPEYGRFSAPFGGFATPGVVVCGLWMLAFALMMCGRRGAARVALVLSILSSIAIPIVNQVSAAGWLGPSMTNLGFLSILALMTLSGSPHRGARVGVGLAIGVTVFAASFAAIPITAAGDAVEYIYERDYWVTLMNSYVLGAVVTIALLAALAIAFAGRGARAAVIALSAVPWIAVWFVSYWIWSKPTEATSIFATAGGMLLVAALLRVTLRRAGVEIVVRRVPTR